MWKIKVKRRQDALLIEKHAKDYNDFRLALETIRDHAEGEILEICHDGIAWEKIIYKIEGELIEVFESKGIDIGASCPWEPYYKPVEEI